ncbi:MAG: cupin domain-containing protein [Bryobacterales bacterium]|nr:cupin domain-containing protein [Bryobacterales bacterium]
MDGFADFVPLNALDALDPDDRAALESAAPLNLNEVAASLGLAVPLATPPPRLRERLMACVHSERLESQAQPSQQVWKAWDGNAADLHVVRHGGEGWQNVREGVWAKQLFVDTGRDMATMLIRMDPGAAYVPHRHGGPEQCFVLEGDIHDGDQVFRQGDFQCAAEGSTHGVQWTEKGCTLLIVSSLRDQLL